MSAHHIELPPLPLPNGITSRIIPDTAARMDFHILEAGYDASGAKPLILLLHGFPELAFSWRKVMLPLASAGFYVVAPDQRGYGPHDRWDPTGDLAQFRAPRLVADMLVLVAALGYTAVRCVVGHDFGSFAAGLCALTRPDIFRSAVLMSAPWTPPAPLPFGTGRPGMSASAPGPGDIHAALAALNPPRKHYHWYNSTPPAAQHWDHPPQGMIAFLRGYFYLKSADLGRENAPHPLRGWVAEELAKMPEYYIMPLDASMPEVVSAKMASEDASGTQRWLSDDDLAAYVGEWERTGFQGGLNWYRARTDPVRARDLDVWAGRKIDVPCVFVSGEKGLGKSPEARGSGKHDREL